MLTSGRMCSPGNLAVQVNEADFEKFIDRDLEIFIQKELLEKKICEFVIPGAGDFEIEITD